jgi:hypothetical protein
VGNQGSRQSKFYIFTILWGVFYLVCLGLTFAKGFSPLTGYYLLLLVGIPLTVMVAIDWANRMPGRKTTLIFVIAGVITWVITLILTRMGIIWRVMHPINTVALLFTGYVIGYWLTGELEKAGHLIPVSILGALVDIWSVFHGPSRSVGEQATAHATHQVETGVWQAPPLGTFALLNFPHPGAEFMTPIFGFGDLVFIAVFIGGSKRFGLSIWKNVLLVIAGLWLSVVAALVTDNPVPALPFICGLFLIGNFRKLELSKKEWKLTIIIAGAVLFIGLLNFLAKLLHLQG